MIANVGSRDASSRLTLLLRWLPAGTAHLYVLVEFQMLVALAAPPQTRPRAAGCCPRLSSCSSIGCVSTAPGTCNQLIQYLGCLCLTQLLTRKDKSLPSQAPVTEREAFNTHSLLNFAAGTLTSQTGTTFRILAKVLFKRGPELQGQTNK